MSDHIRQLVTRSISNGIVSQRTLDQCKAILDNVRFEVPGGNKVKPISTTMNFSGDVELSISNLQKRYEAINLKGKTGFLMISVKNKCFSNRLLERYFDFVEKYLGKGFVMIVDSPYIHNIYAMNYDEKTKQAKIKKLKQISEENQRRVTRLLRKRSSHNIKPLSWTELERETPQWLVDEVTSAFNKKGEFYCDLIEQTQKILPQGTANGRNLENFSQFLIRETPVLCAQYYLRDDRVVDIYPGEHPHFLWKIEAGCYSDELPRISEIAQRGHGLIYVNFRLKNLVNRAGS